MPVLKCMVVILLRVDEDHVNVLSADHSELESSEDEESNIESDSIVFSESESEGSDVAFVKTMSPSDADGAPPPPPKSADLLPRQPVRKRAASQEPTSPPREPEVPNRAPGVAPKVPKPPTIGEALAASPLPPEPARTRTQEPFKMTLGALQAASAATFEAAEVEGAAASTKMPLERTRMATKMKKGPLASGVGGGQGGGSAGDGGGGSGAEL